MIYFSCSLNSLFIELSSCESCKFLKLCYHRNFDFFKFRDALLFRIFFFVNKKNMMTKDSKKCFKDLEKYLLQRQSHLDSFQALSQRSLEVVIANYNELVVADTKDNGQNKKIPPQLMVDILDVLPCDKLDLCIGAQYVHNEGFWKRAALQKFGSGKCVLESHGLSWKRLYYEMYLNHLLSKGDGLESNEMNQKVSSTV